MRLAILRSRAYGVQVSHEGSHLELVDALVSMTEAAQGPVDGEPVEGILAAGEDGFGVFIGAGATASLQRTAVLGNRAVGIAVRDPSPGVVLEDVTVANTRFEEINGRWGNGMVIRQEATLLGRRLLFRGNNSTAVAVEQGATAELEDLIVTDCLPDPFDQTAGRGLHVREATATVHRAYFTGNHEVAVIAMDPGTRLALSDVWVTGTEPQPSDEQFGRGLVAQNQARIDVTRGAIFGNREIGVHGLNAELSLRDVRIQDTLPALSEGHGLVIHASSLEAERFFIRSNQLAGVLIGPGNTVRAEDGLIAQNLIGLSVQDNTFDVTASFVRVLSIDNELDRDVSEIPLPRAAALRDGFGPMD